MAANFVGHILIALNQIALVPLFLRAWGPQLYGEWLTITAAVSYIAFCDAGVHSYVGNTLRQHFVRGEWARFGRVFNSAILLIRTICLIGASIVVVLSALPVRRILALQAMSDRVAAALVAAVGAQMLLRIANRFTAAMFQAVGEYARGLMMQHAQMAVAILAAACMLQLGLRPVWIAAAESLVLCVGMVAAITYLKRRHVSFAADRGSADWSLAKSFLAPSAQFVLIQAATLLALQGSVLAVNHVLGAKYVASFVLLRTLANIPRQFNWSVCATFWPESTALDASGRRQTLATVQILTTKLLMAAALIAAVLLLSVGPHLVPVWTRGRVQCDLGLMSALLAGALLQPLWLTSSVVLSASNNHANVARLTVLSAASGLAIGTALMPSVGLPGLGWALTAAEAMVLGGILPIQSCKHLGIEHGFYYREILGRGLLTAALISPVVLLVRLMAPDCGGAWTEFSVATATLGISVATYRCWLTAAEREATLRAISRISAWGAVRLKRALA